MNALTKGLWQMEINGHLCVFNTINNTIKIKLPSGNLVTKNYTEPIKLTDVEILQAELK